MKWSKRIALIAGLALIGVTNVVALGGAAYNRSGEPDSSLALSQRELRPPYVWTGKKENSGLGLSLNWRVVPTVVPGAGFYAGGGGSPEWLDQAKMVSLGFDARATSTSGGFGRGPGHERQLSRDVLVVLELDGPAYQEALRRAKQAASAVESKNDRGDGKKNAQVIMDREEQLSSRLFAVDAGLDLRFLRENYPNRSKYAIVHGQVRPDQTAHTSGGSIESLNATTINVPLEMRDVFEGILPVMYALPTPQDKHFDATVEFGRRLEPWLASATRR